MSCSVMDLIRISEFEEEEFNGESGMKISVRFNSRIKKNLHGVFDVIIRGTVMLRDAWNLLSDDKTDFNRSLG